MLTIALGVVAVPAHAAGNGGGGQNGDAQAAAHAAASANAAANSAAPPGQVKKAEQAAQPTVASTPPVASDPANDSAQGQAKKTSDSAAVKPSNSAARQPKKADSSAGVKPSNSTFHKVSASAGSSSTKLYGNGQTAGQIAIANGADAAATLYGPGNSQPHKTTPCGQLAHGKGGGYDVHALKSHTKKGGCRGEPTSSGTPSTHASSGTPSKNGGVSTPKDPSVSSSTKVGGSTAPSADRGVARSPHRASGVDAVNGGADNTSGVLAAVETAGGATLPFTGFPLWLVSLVAIVVTGGGLAIRRQARSVA